MYLNVKKLARKDALQEKIDGQPYEKWVNLISN